MTRYSKEELRRIFQSPFDQEAWKAIVINLFRADKVRREKEPLTNQSENEEGYYLGSAETPDSYRIGLFYYKIKQGSVAHKKVGLRNLVKGFINQNWGEFDAAIVVFDGSQEWRLSFVCDIKEQATTPKRFTFVFGEKDNQYRTPIERFDVLQGQEATFENIRKAFSVEALSNDFFNEYRELYADFVQYITGKRYVKESGKWVERPLDNPNHQYEDTFEGNDKLVRDYIKKMFGRIVFLYFLQRKGWLAGNRNYMHDLYAKSDKKDNFLDGVLEPLFFEVLNEKPENRQSSTRELPGVDRIPYLNGGLFAKDEIDDRKCVFPKDYFGRLFGFLDSYNFTIDENDTEDAEIGIDPEMLGRIFENLLEDNKDKGAFYTPKEIVGYMCRESIIAYLQSKDFSKEGNELIRQFVETLDSTLLTKEQRTYIKDKLKEVKICDPAIGSGAFPMGLVNLLAKLYASLRIKDDAAVIKRHIMEQNIYGVDIEKGAVDIARLRFWLAMIVEEKEPMPLPNLHFKIMQGNSLLESYNGIDLSDLTKVKEYGNIFEIDSTDNEDLVRMLKKYYKTSDHTERDRLFDEIIKNVRRQLYAKEVTLPKGMDPSENSEFFLWHTWFSDVFEKGGFDIIIGNPPYIEAKKLKNIAYLLKKHYGVYSGTADMSIYFLELGINTLAPSGVLSYITTNKFFNTGYGAPLRQLLLQNSLSKIINFEQVEVFKGILVSSVIVEVQKHAASFDNKFVYEKFYKLSSDEFKTQFVERRGKFGSYSQEFLDENEWSFADAAQLLLKRKLEEDSTSLKDLPGVNVFRGVTTGYNPAFLIDSAQKAALTTQEPECASIIKPMLQGRNIRKWYYNFNNEHMIFTRKGYNIDSFEPIKNHLLNFYDDLKPKDPDIPSDEQTGRKPGKYQWFEILDNTAYYPHFEYPEKIIWGLTADKWAFTLDTKKHYLPSNGYILTSETIPTKYILGLLNSKLMHHYFSYIGVMTAGGAYTLKAATIEALPFKIADDTSTIEGIVDRILSAKDANPEADVNDLEDKIDRFVYKLYGLIYNDVCLIDPETPITREEYENFNIEDICLD